MNRADILKRPSYWFEHTQNELFRQVSSYMKNEDINQTELAERLKVGKSYVSQILNGNCNFSLKKWIELCLAIGIVPGEYRKIEDVLQTDIDFANAKKVEEKKTEIQTPVVSVFEPFDMSTHFDKKNIDSTQATPDTVIKYAVLNTMELA